MWKDYILKDNIEGLGYDYDSLKDKCGKDILSLDVEEIAFETILKNNKEYLNILIEYLYDNKDFVCKRVIDCKNDFIPFERGFVLSFLKCKTKKDIEEFIMRTCMSMLRNFLSIIFCSSTVFENSFKEIEGMLEDEKDSLDNDFYKEIFEEELVSLIKSKPGYYKKVPFLAH